MILVAFAALGLAMARYPLDTQILTGWSTYLSIGGTPVLAGLSTGLLVLRLRKPRPAIGRLFRQPGAAASLAACPTIGIWMGITGIWWLRGDPLRALNRFTYIGVGGGSAVLAAWLVLLLARAARPEPGWLDRAGTALGMLWIFLMLLIFYHEFG
jgi:hypothetical protein